MAGGVDMDDPFGGEVAGAPPVVLAAFEGECALNACTADILEGDDIRWSDAFGSWTHADCWEGVA